MEEEERRERNRQRQIRIRRRQVRRLKTIVFGFAVLLAVIVLFALIGKATGGGKKTKEKTAAESKIEKQITAKKQADKEARKKKEEAPEPYVWASPKGAVDGNQCLPITENDPSKQEGTTKIIYLTFDDGPGQYTAQLLDILAAHNAKATFFVTNQDPDYADLIKREAEEGHSIAVHTYSHDYKTIYASSDAYWSDFEQEQAIIEEQTGFRSQLMRFPGGSSNTVSDFSPGIMTELTQEADEKGYVYFDWNASSGDGGSQTDSASVIALSQQECSYDDTSVLLCHDIKETTVNAIDQLLTWGEQNGYTFLPLSPYSFPAHHQVNN